MKRIIFGYGIVSGSVVIITTLIGLSLAKENASFSFDAWLGFLIMFIALSSIYVAIKRFRDQNPGGVITFGKAMQIGLGISAVAGVVYVGGWEIYLFMTDYIFINDYTQFIVESRQSAGATETEMAEVVADMDRLKTQYANPLFRLPMTFVEIFPVGLVVSLVSAGVLRKH